MTPEQERLALYDAHNDRRAETSPDFGYEQAVAQATAAGSTWFMHYGDQPGRGDQVAMPDVPDHSWSTWGWSEASGPPAAAGPSHLVPPPT